MFATSEWLQIPEIFFGKTRPFFEFFPTGYETMDKDFIYLFNIKSNKDNGS